MAMQHIHELSDADLNAAIAERVMGRRVAYLDPLPDYAQDIAAAWAVIEHLREQGWLVVVKAMPDNYPFYLDDDYEHKLLKRYTCHLSWMKDETPEGMRKRVLRHPWAFGETVGQSVGRAALEAAEDREGR